MKIIVNEYDSKIQTHSQADETRMNVEVPQLHQASATEDGSYVTLGHCRKECLAKLPAVPFAVPPKRLNHWRKVGCQARTVAFLHRFGEGHVLRIGKSQQMILMKNDG